MGRLRISISNQFPSGGHAALQVFERQAASQLMAGRRLATTLCDLQMVLVT